jgi:hypothetical protein
MNPEWYRFRLACPSKSVFICENLCPIDKSLVLLLGKFQYFFLFDFQIGDLNTRP